MKKLHISPDLALPLEAVTETIVVFGRKGQGKTVFGSVLAEELDAAGQRFVVIDPMGVWWGLQHSGDGKGKGLDVLLLGGRRGDLPVLPTGGAVIADLVVDEAVNVVVDISRDAAGKMWKRAERIRFVRDFATRFFERQGEKMRPCMLIVDEAARFVPQTITKGDTDVAACCGAVEQLVEEGRNVGIGVCLITQRSARINKSVSELAGCMVAFQTVGPNSVEAVVDWLGEHIEKVKWADYIEQLRRLPRGQALIVSPGWLNFEGVVPIRMRSTFDSSKTPKFEGRGVPRKDLRPDLAKYRELMHSTIEEAKANDPKELRRQVADLKKHLAAASAAKAKGTAPSTPMLDLGLEKELTERLAEVKLLKEAGIKKVQDLLAAFHRLDVRREELIARMAEKLRPLEESLATIAAAAKAPVRPAAPPRPAMVDRLSPRPAVRTLPQKAPPAASADLDGDGGELTPSEWAVLQAIAQFPSGASRGRTAVFSGRSRKSSSFDGAFRKLERKGLIQRAAGEKYLATAEGSARVGVEPVPPGAASHDVWLAKLLPSEQKIFQALLEAWPERLTKAQVSERTGQSMKSSSFDNAFPALRDLELIEGHGDYKASDLFFEGDHA